MTSVCIAVAKLHRSTFRKKAPKRSFYSLKNALLKQRRFLYTEK